MQIVKEKISIDELTKMSEKMFGNLVKAVVDIEKEIMAVDAELHADGEELLLNDGSELEHLWGVNIYPKEVGKENFIICASMINFRPLQNNRSRYIEDPKIQERIIDIVNKLVQNKNENISSISE